MQPRGAREWLMVLPLCDVEVDLAPGGSLELLVRSTPGNFGLGCGMRVS